jgi:IS30 family transposase
MAKKPYPTLEEYLLKRKLAPVDVAKMAAKKGFKLSTSTIYNLIRRQSIGTVRTRFALASVLGINDAAVDGLLDGRKAAGR